MNTEIIQILQVRDITLGIVLKPVRALILSYRIPRAGEGKVIDKIAKIDREDIARVLDIVGVYFDTEAIADITEVYIDIENEEIEIRGFGV